MQCDTRTDIFLAKCPSDRTITRLKPSKFRETQSSDADREYIVGATPNTTSEWMQSFFRASVMTATPLAKEPDAPSVETRSPELPESPRPERGPMTADELRQVRAYPRLFDLEGVPVRVRSKSEAPEAYAGDGQWRTLPKTTRLLIQGRYVTAKRFADLCERFDHFIDDGGPFVE
jgi:hypothetical protein